MNLFTEFEAAVATSKNLPKRPDNPTLLKLYGLFKQATAGDTNGEQPDALNFVARAKWDAWNALRGMTQNAAQQQYISLVDELKS
jgi:diazepam-binding inhibitor (GABA receptor modulating acyl-CoA-binding protein)